MKKSLTFLAGFALFIVTVTFLGQQAQAASSSSSSSTCGALWKQVFYGQVISPDPVPDDEILPNRKWLLKLAPSSPTQIVTTAQQLSDLVLNGCSLKVIKKDSIAPGRDGGGNTYSSYECDDITSQKDNSTYNEFLCSNGKISRSGMADADAYQGTHLIFSADGKVYFSPLDNEADWAPASISIFARK